MTVVNGLFIIFYTVFFVILLLLIFQKGIYGTFELFRDSLEAMVRRIVYGPDQKGSYEGKYTCRVLHQNARTEVDIYGTILSQSVLAHVKKCTKYPSVYLYPKVLPRPPRPHDPKCKHKGTMSNQVELDGTKHVYCTKCDYYKRIAAPTLPDMGRWERR